jgi:hypothetical protein
MIKEIATGKVTKNQFADLSHSLESDLMALFGLMQDEVRKLIDKAGREGMSLNDLLKEIEEMI